MEIEWQDEERDILSSKCERALLIGFRHADETAETAENHLSELHDLVVTMGIEPVERMMVPLKQPQSRFYTGSGKADEIMNTAEDRECDLIIYDDELSPSQQRNLENLIPGMAVIDRQEVILDIFADRATTREAILQVALARMEYSMPRLTRAWTHLSRQRGGAKGTRGKGETQLESDRRMVLTRITTLKQEIKKVKSNRELMRKKRDQAPFPSAAIAGYTNAGKSSLLTMLTNCDILVEDKVFATLDPTSRKLKLKGGKSVILTDTVGFIRKLPHDLVDAFHSTLEEVAMADVIVHVMDASSPELTAHAQVTEQVLRELGVEEQPIIHILNKWDLVEPTAKPGIKSLFPGAITMSCVAETGKDNFMDRLSQVFSSLDKTVTFYLPQNKWDIRALISRTGTILEEDITETEIIVKAMVGKTLAKKLSSYIKD